MNNRIILHIDVNNAFLSWTAVNMLKNGHKVDIRNRFSVIGGDEKERRGVILAKSIPAKRMGIITGESLYMAKKKCLNLEVYAPDFKVYSYYSNKMYEYLTRYSDKIERYSIDECFIDYTASVKLFGDPIKLAYKIKEDIKTNFGFTVNIGIGYNKLCAKMASDFKKPDMVHTLFPEELASKMWPLPVSELFMIGKKSSEKLINMGIKTIDDLAHMDINMLIKYFNSHGKLMHEYANGIDNSIVECDYGGPKSISSSTVLPYDYRNQEDIIKIIRDLSMDVGSRIRKQKYMALVVFVSIKYSDFSKVSKQLKLERAINSDNDLYNNFANLFKKIWNLEPVRNICVGVNNFKYGEDIQLSLFDNNQKITTEKEIQEVVDKLRNKFGKDKIIYGDMLKKTNN